MNKVVLVTGASSGIGKITAEYLVQKGFTVYGSSRDPEYNNLTFKCVLLNLNKEETIVDAVRTIIQKEGRIDVLVNNAGTGITGSIEETPTKEIRKSFYIFF